MPMGSVMGCHYDMKVFLAAFFQATNDLNNFMRLGISKKQKSAVVSEGQAEMVCHISKGFVCLLNTLWYFHIFMSTALLVPANHVILVAFLCSRNDVVVL